MRVLLLPLLVVTAAACNRGESPPSNPNAPPGAEKQLDTRALEQGAELLQNLSPVRALDHYLNGFHVMKDDRSLHMEAHHYCKGMNEEFTQCVIFDGNTDSAVYEALAADEKPHWHPHNYEILSGQLILPGVPAVAEKATLKKKLNSYGKTWHVWDTGHAGHPAAHAMPVGKPLLAWSYTRDGEIPTALLEARDPRMKVDTAEKRAERAELAAKAKPQSGS